MKFLLVAMNAKYIHSNLGVYSLMAYGKRQVPEAEIEIGEYTINHRMETVLHDIFKKKPDMVGFSCYIWNIVPVMELVRDLHKVLPGVPIWLGGPEVSFDADSLLLREPEVTGVMMGEGEETFSRLLRAAVSKSPVDGGEDGLSFLPGTVVRDRLGNVVVTPLCSLPDLDVLPFAYENLEGLENRIVYYESSRGCPFSCSYCLSSLDKTVRFRSLALVKKELNFFLESKVPQVKFVDRTFNCSRDHTLAVWRHILEHDNGITNFHFEISADLLDEEELEIMAHMRPGLIQLEIGVQTANLRTISEIHRKTDLDRLTRTVRQINSGRNIHQHLDLIAGLPFEDYKSFASSFNRVYEMEPEQLQLGFLKVLKGSYMEEAAEDYGLVFTELPPYEVLSTKWLSYEELSKLKAVEEMVEVYYNSRQFKHTLELLCQLFSTPFALFESLGVFYEEQELNGLSHSRMARYEILHNFLRSITGEDNLLSSGRDRMMVDLYLRENSKSRPSFASDQASYKEAVRRFFKEEEGRRQYLKNYESYDSRQMAKMAHLEFLECGRVILFDYKNRDPLTYNAAAYEIK